MGHNEIERESITIRTLPNSSCPECKHGALTAIECISVSAYYYFCGICGARFDTDAEYDAEKDEFWRIGKLRNPDYWNINYRTMEEGLLEFKARREKGIKPYLGEYRIERIK